MKDLDSKFAKMRSEVDKDKVAASVRKEALGPTRDAIKVCSPGRVLPESSTLTVHLVVSHMRSRRSNSCTHSSVQNLVIGCHISSTCSGMGHAAKAIV